ncbi:MAG: tRNA (N6-threonylcarbamoyladenosine(37)-N6)-methyltransferase TrmO [Negativicutes bacterium]|nr:tRNA (N6-threonylcarbamoyladenosine(37)-N6)-methyltransferase TrmO [Negativicutes bacterium]
MTIEIEAIGTVKSPVTEGVDADWGGVISQIHIKGELASGLKGLEEFSDLLVIFWLHRSTFAADSDLVRRPQGRDDMPLVGIFAQRAKHRPNPIGVTAVKLLAVEGNILTVRGLDAIDGTPVLDIKPYYPAYDCRATTQVPEWVGRLMKDYF